MSVKSLQGRHYKCLLLVFKVRQSYCARYSYMLDVCLSVRPTVRPSNKMIAKMC